MEPTFQQAINEAIQRVPHHFIPMPLIPFRTHWTWATYCYTKGINEVIKYYTNSINYVI